MKALRIHDYGTRDDLKLEEAPKPLITDDEVLVKVYAAAVNHIDALKAYGLIKQIYPLKFPWIPGADFAGIIESVGKNVTAFKKGDEVYGSNSYGGAYAEYIAVKSGNISIKPKKLSFAEAASVTMVAETARQGLFEHAHLSAGETILIHGGAGAVGSFAIQMADQAGATVITTASTADKEYLESLGADVVIDYKTQKFESLVSNVDVVFDLVGGDVQQKSYQVLKEGGKMITTNQPPSTEDAEKHQVFAKMMHGEPVTEGLKHIAKLLDWGALKFDIAKIYPFEDAGKAWESIADNLIAAKSKSAGDEPKNKKHGKHVLQIV